jgi:hypothetical protein
MAKISDFLNKINPFSNRSSAQKGKVYPNPMNRLYEQMAVENDRKKIYEECWLMYVEDPRIAAAIDTTAGSATNGSFTIQFNKANSTSEAIIKDADEILNNTKKKCSIDGKVAGIGKEMLILGDVFMEVIVDEENLVIVDLKKLPARTIIREEDDYGNLIRFVQKNDMDQIIATFEPWQILHMRWNHFAGHRYGTSAIRAIRSVYKKLKMAEEDLVIRRRTRAGLKMHHYGANPEEPLEEWEVDDYIKQNQSSPLNVRTDFYSNGKWKIEVLESDDGVTEIDDIKHLEDSLFIGLRTPKGLLGIGEDPNRATLDRQEVAYIRMLNELTNVISEQLRVVFDLALNLKGISPDSVEYDMVWEEKTIEDVNRKVERLVLLANGGFISRQTAVGEMSYDFDDEQEKIADEMKKYGSMDYMQFNFDSKGNPKIPLRGEEGNIAKGDPQLTGGEGRDGNRA